MIDSIKPLTLSVKEASRISGIKPHTIRYWIRQGKLKGSKLGETVVVDRADLLTKIGHADKV